ncbi:MAG: hypothetical protein BRC28_03625 [Nanohaloarchaea archaeon SW_4_43_9]|nr:MAG: hypothetical protein BRC28_03625 [Nanohaloarchaea archaeon SW_4_43_9]
MHPALKILVGALMVTLGVYSTLGFWPEVLTFVKAGIGPLLVLVGAFIVWLESDELKMRREQKESSQTDGMQRQFTEAIEGETDEGVEQAQPVQEGNTCSECGKTFDTERGMHIHQAQKHE